MARGVPQEQAARAWLMGVAAGLLLAGCSDSGGERRFRYAEAVEVPVPIAEREDLAGLLAAFAQRNGLSFHDTSPRAQRLSNGKQTLALLIERPLTRGQLRAEIGVTADGNGPALVTFAEPLDKGVAADAASGRAQLIAELRGRWPGTRQVPLLPDGGLPR